ncbi:CARDB domain-containing protein [uncultured Lamprocystis sp.]|uniref:RCC1 domain-containing protein n=1 Tax=uncultured Lamprocystis sp. TaxID=543132 RepID=UPI0025F10BB6|nr:CARDB domain-containing protein [uncultured Lamprocystis sp.]
MIFERIQHHPGARGQRGALFALCLILVLSLVLGQAAAGLTPWAASVVAAGNPEMRRLAAGNYHSLAIKTDGTLWVWGHNGQGQLGDGTWTDRLTPVQILTGVAAVSAGFFHSLAIKTNGSLWAWGYNPEGRLGDGTTRGRSTPVQVLTGVAAMSAGDGHTLALKTDGSAWTWGENWKGQLGDGTTTDRLTPVQVLNGVAAVAAGDSHSLAIKTDNTLWAWGYNGNGELGDGTSADRWTPIQILSGVAAVAAGGHHNVALKTDGSVWTWGRNIGDGSYYSLYTPVQVMTGVAAVSAGNYYALALKADGNLWAWGWNQDGEVGDGTNTWRRTPVQVMTGVAAMDAGAWVGKHTLALKTDGSLWAWGDNLYGQLGDGTTTDRWRPVPVFGFAEPPTSTADFTVTNITLNPSAPLAGGTFNASITVKNRGTQAGNPGILRVWANQRATQDCAAPGGADINLATLAAGAKQTVQISLPAGPAGYKTLRTFIDSQCLSAEPDETNNQDVKGYRVFAQPIADFGVTAIDLTPNRPTAGGIFSAAVTVKNRGTAPGDAGTLALWVDQPGVPACGAAGDAVAAVGTLAAGASTILTLDGLPAGTAAAKSLRAFIDATCVNAEAYDGNNQQVKPYTVVP